jgi:hypothetical protein
VQHAAEHRGGRRGGGPDAEASGAESSERSESDGRYQQNMLLPYPQFGFCHIV